MTTLFISDLHLEPGRLDIAQAFLAFLQKEAPHCDALYILGDLFEVWIGDDFENPFVQQLKEALHQFSQAGAAVYFMHGNRDFLVGEQFAEQTGCQLLTDPCVIDLYGQPTLLMHGDTLCTEDVGYLKLRAMVRDPQWQAQVLSKNIEERIQLAQNIRGESQQAMTEKSAEIMDVTPDEVVRVMEAHGVQQLIHGHTHRPAVHDLTANDQSAQRIVLGDWHQKGWVLRVSEDNQALEPFAFGG